jgi:hypothetical protein
MAFSQPMSSAPRDALDDKVNQVFAGKCVREDLVRPGKVGSIELGLTVALDTLASNTVRPDEVTKA